MVISFVLQLIYAVRNEVTSTYISLQSQPPLLVYECMNSLNNPLQRFRS